jgi:carboxyl-terminal processing protease
MRRTALLVGTGLILTGLTFVLGLWVGRLQDSGLSGFQLVSDVVRLVRENYLGTLPDEDVLGRAMSRGFVAALEDPYSMLVDPPAQELETDLLTGAYGGIGADLIRDAEGNFHIVPYPDGPAGRAGITETDVLVSVDQTRLDSTLTHEEVTALLRGPEGSVVTLGVRGSSPGADVRTVGLIRETFALPSVTSYLFPDDRRIVVIRVSLFSETTAGEMDQAIREAVAGGAEAVLLDLRGTPGGLLEAAVDSARLFLADGIIVVEEFTDGDERAHRVEGPGPWLDVPLVLAVDGSTASAAEIVAGALQRQGRAVLVGQSTVGKGSVQSIFPLPDGSSLHLTTARWMLGDGEPVPEGGLTPDRSVPIEAGDPDQILRQAAEWLRAGGWLQ